MVSGKHEKLLRVSICVCSLHALQVSCVSQVHPARVQQRNGRRQVAGRTPNVGRLRKRRRIAQFHVHTQHSGKDPLHRRAPATHGIATAGARHIQTARRCHARKFGIKYTSSEAPNNVLCGPICRTTEGRGQTSVERSRRVRKIAKSNYQPGHVCPHGTTPLPTHRFS
jgi:hypothetical protein